jgi:dipeptidyl aminopeptidase/acylaminoacyl peptidase
MKPYLNSLLLGGALALGLAAPVLAAVPAAVTTAPARELTDPHSLTSPARPGVQPAPVSDLYFLRSSWFAAWSPNGKDVVISTDLTGRINLWRVPADGGFPLQLQQSDDKAFYPTVTPDGAAVIYASDRGGGEIYDLFSTPLAGGPVTNLTHSDDASETGPVVSPDSRAIAFDRRGKTDSATNIGLLNLADGQVRLLTHEPAPGIYWHAVAFSKDGSRLIANRGSSSLSDSTVWSIDPATGKATLIAGDPASKGYQSASAISPDGKLLAMTSESASGKRQAVVLDLATGKRTVLADSPWEQHSAGFSPDGRTVLAVSNVDGRDSVFTYDIASGAARELAIRPGMNSDFFGSLPAFSPDGSRILYPHSAGGQPFDYWTYDLAKGTSQPLTRLGLGTVEAANLPQSQIVHYKSRDGLVISAVMWMPFNLKRDGSAPAVVIAHGGPTGQTVDNFDPTAIALASRGYVVIAPNPRGSTGYGRAFEEANVRDLGGGDLADEAAGAQFLVESGYVDQKKLGITGGSYGGYMTVMALAKMPDFWAAGVEEYGIVNWNSMWERGSPALREYQRGLIGDPVKDKDVYARVSPLTYLKDTKAPLLVLQGENDIRVPKYEAEQIVATLKAAGRTVDATYYPEEGHGFLKREHQIDALEQTVRWFDKYLKGAS